VPGLANVVALAASYEDTVALRGDGTIWAWGHIAGDFYGQATAPRLLPRLRGVLAVAAGEGHSLALTRDGLVWAWGNNFYGQMGNGSDVGGPFVVAQQVPHLSEVIALAAGYPYNLVVRRDGTVWAWGINGRGELGTGDTRTVAGPVAVRSPNLIVNVP
jgi:alpha-tubulin suppressor-like RCC1 family protein